MSSDPPIVQGWLSLETPARVEELCTDLCQYSTQPLAQHHIRITLHHVASFRIISHHFALRCQTVSGAAAGEQPAKALTRTADAWSCLSVRRLSARWFQQFQHVAKGLCFARGMFRRVLPCRAVEPQSAAQGPVMKRGCLHVTNLCCRCWRYRSALVRCEDFGWHSLYEAAWVP